MDYLGHDPMIGTPTVVVTGASGYLGSLVLERLRAEGTNAAGINRNGSDDLIACDMEDTVSSIDLISGLGAATVVHCAAAIPKDAVGYADEAAAEASLRMVEALIAAGPEHIVFASSMTVYAETTSMPACEEDAPEPGAGYAGGKRRAEVRLLARNGIAVTVLRFPGLFGPPRRGGLLYNTALALAAGETPSLPEEPPLWAALHVNDAADLCVRAVSRKPAGKLVLNAGYPGPFSITDAVNALAKLFGQPSLIDTPAPRFEMELSRLGSALGLPSHSFDERLGELASWTRLEAASAATE